LFSPFWPSWHVPKKKKRCQQFFKHVLQHHALSSCQCREHYRFFKLVLQHHAVSSCQLKMLSAGHVQYWSHICIFET
jgi:hypothetical protein